MSTLEHEQLISSDIKTDKLPEHIAIIMDGNNRWARKKKLPGIAGHREGVKAVRRAVECCQDYNVKRLTLFAFSSENWHRPKDEVGALMELFLRALQHEVKKLHEHGVHIQFIGDLSAFTDSIRQYIQKAEALTADNDRVSLIIAAGYGGRWDIVQAAKTIARDVQQGLISLDDISDNLFEKYLTTQDIPPPDLLIRTSGEQRISNFLLWQCAYTEMYFTDVLWPDFGVKDFEQAMLAYTGRQRRYGKTSEQIQA